MLDVIESRLQECQWLGGQSPSQDDAEGFASLNGAVPDVDMYPNAFAWYAMVSKFSEAKRASWSRQEAAKQKVNLSAPEETKERKATPAQPVLNDGQEVVMGHKKQVNSSKAMTQVLRHGAENKGVAIRSDGFVLLEDLL